MAVRADIRKGVRNSLLESIITEDIIGRRRERAPVKAKLEGDL
jgi:hypothetical protein